MTDFSEDDFFAELNAELATLTKKETLRGERNIASKLAHNSRLSSSVRAAAMEEYKLLSALLKAEKWRAIETIALFQQQDCDSCGSSHRMFIQYMEVEELIRLPSTRKWHRVARPSDNLPKGKLTQTSVTHICAECCEDYGFQSDTEKSLGTIPEFTLSPTYHQEDLNDATSIQD